MKTIKAVLPALLIVLAALFFMGNFVAGLKSAKKERAQNGSVETHTKATTEKPFVILIASFNNSAYCTKNLNSVFEQHYSNYRVIYIDDASTDDTYEKVRKLIKKNHKEDKVELIRNERNLKPAENIYRGIHTCKDEEIVVLLDGDDWFAHEDVLTYLNNCYADPKVWMTYGSYCEYPSYKKGSCRGEIPKKVHAAHSYRAYAQKKFVFSHLRTAYAGLFKKVRMEDLLREGKFLSCSGDQAFMIPLAEMAAEHAIHIKDILYIYNRKNPINDDKIYLQEQIDCARYIHALSPYSAVDDWRKEEKALLGSDLLVFSKNRPLQLYAFLESIKKNVKGISQLTVFYECKDEPFRKAYEEVKEAFPDFQFSVVDSNFEQHLVQSVTSSPAHFVLFAEDQEIIKEPLDLTSLAEELQRRGAFGFFLNLNEAVSHPISLDSLYAWQFQSEQKKFFQLEMALLAKETVLEIVKGTTFTDFDSFNGLWASCADTKRVGLFFENSKTVKMPLKDSPDQLLTKFQEGLKIDLSPFFQTKNETVNVDYEPTFVKR